MMSFNIIKMKAYSENVMMLTPNEIILCLKSNLKGIIKMGVIARDSLSTS